MNDIKNRERRLRYQARKKGLVIQKETKKDYGQVSFVSGTSYLILNEDSKFVVTSFGYPIIFTGDSYHDNILPLEEAESFITAY